MITLPIPRFAGYMQGVAGRITRRRKRIQHFDRNYAAGFKVVRALFTTEGVFFFQS